ncbi:unnamed protein product, partial [Prorocentrum cordatum]
MGIPRVGGGVALHVGPWAPSSTADGLDPEFGGGAADAAIADKRAHIATNATVCLRDHCAAPTLAFGCWPRPGPQPAATAPGPPEAVGHRSEVFPGACPLDAGRSRTPPPSVPVPKRPRAATGSSTPCPSAPRTPTSSPGMSRSIGGQASRSRPAGSGGPPTRPATAARSAPMVSPTTGSTATTGT